MRRMWAASAAISLSLAFGAPALAQDASPVPAQGEVLYEITVPPEAIPDALGKIVVDEWMVAPGTDVSIPYDNEGILGRGMYLESGGLTVTPAYDALLWVGGAALGGTPVSAPAGQDVSLAAGDVLLLPAVARDQLDPAAEVGIANPGTETALVFAFHMHWWERFPGWPKGIRSTQGITFGWPDELGRVQAGDTVFRLTQLTLQPGEALPFPDDAAFVYDYLKSGVLNDWTILGSGPKERAVDVERKEHIVSGDVPAEVLELAVIPPVGATVAEPEAPAPAGNVWVTGTETCTQVTAGTTSYENGVEQYRDGVFECIATTSDPRVGGSFTDHFNFDCHELTAPQTGHGGCTLWGTAEWAGPDGWTGSFSGLEDANGQSFAQGVAVGTGANTGWTYIALTTWSDDTSVAHQITGLLYQGPPPEAE